MSSGEDVNRNHKLNYTLKIRAEKYQNIYTFKIL